MSKQMKNVLVAGATGYLGSYLLKELKQQGYKTTALVRNPRKLEGIEVDNIIEAEVTQPETLKGKLNGIDYVISTVGITRQKDGLTYRDVDYEANVNLLKESLKANVGKFVYISVLNGPDLRHLKMVDAKESFVDELEASGIDHLVVRPNGFFSDMMEFLEMAQKGTVYLFGNGEFRANPIHGADLAAFTVGEMTGEWTELDIGGPNIMPQNEIAEVAFKAVGKKRKTVHVPLWVKNVVLGLTRFFTNSKTYGPVEFFMTVMTRDMVAPKFGSHYLKDFYRDEVADHSIETGAGVM